MLCACGMRTLWVRPLWLWYKNKHHPRGMVFVFMAQEEGFEPPCLLGKRFSIQRALSSRIVEMCSRHSLASFLVALLTSFVKNSYQLFFAPHPLWPHTNLIQKIEKHQPKSWCFLAQAEGFEPPCRLGKRFSRPPRCDHFDKPAYEILLNTWAFEVARRRRIKFATFGYRRNKPAYFLKFVFRILAQGEYLRQSRNIPAY